MLHQENAQKAGPGKVEIFVNGKIVAAGDLSEIKIEQGQVRLPDGAGGWLGEPSGNFYAQIFFTPFKAAAPAVEENFEAETAEAKKVLANIEESGGPIVSEIKPFAKKSHMGSKKNHS
jgi:hypothetical protein